MNWKEMEFEWKWELNPSAPKFPVWICFELETGFENFSLLESVDQILCEPLNLSSPHFDSSERLIDSKGDIYKTIFVEYQIPKLLEKRLTLPILKKIMDKTDIDEFEQYLKFDNIESFITNNQIK